MIDRFLSKTGVGIALLFMVAELSYINSLSLMYMFNKETVTDIVFGIIGAIAFSIVTVLVMRLGKRNWLKLVFPLFDVALVFCGFNLQHYHDMFENPVRFYMSVFLSAFAGLITYSLGQINDEQHQDTHTDTEKLKLNLELTQNLLSEANNRLAYLERYFALHEKSRILKKLEKNRTPEEVELLNKVE